MSNAKEEIAAKAEYQKPLKASTIEEARRLLVPGEKYFTTVIDLDQILWLYPPFEVVRLVPTKKAVEVKFLGTSRACEAPVQSLEYIGVMVDGKPNNNRTFLFDERTYNYFKQLRKDDDVEAYLASIKGDPIE